MHTVSFFSFKGGVGRTNLLLNVAYGLAREGAFVVIADWDLQAPGLTVMERLSQPIPEGAEEAGYPEGSDVRRGVLDFLDAILQEKVPIPDPKTMARPTRLGHEARLSSLNKGPAFQGDIWFIPAGRFDPQDENHEYHRQLLRVQGRNLAGWKVRYDEEGDVGDPLEIPKYFRSRVELVEHEKPNGRRPDYLLIDSRTGMTEIGDLLMAVDFADRMVVVAGLNDQNLAGLEAVVRDLQNHIPPGEILSYLTLVLAPVPQGEEELKSARLDRIRQLMEGLARDVGHGERELMPEPRLQVPYHPRIALTEDLMVELYPESEPARAALAVVEEIKQKHEVVPVRII